MKQPRQGDIGWPQIQRLLERGKTPREIAITLGCSPQNIYGRMKRRGWPLTNGKDTK